MALRLSLASLTLQPTLISCDLLHTLVLEFAVSVYVPRPHLSISLPFLAPNLSPAVGPAWR